MKRASFSCRSGKDSMPKLHRALVVEQAAHGGRARVLCVDAHRLEASCCGREVEAGSLADLPAGIDGCGEHVGFLAFVFDGPCLARPAAQELVRVHDIGRNAPAPGRYLLAELRSCPVA